MDLLWIFAFTIRDVPVDIYGGLWFFPEGREISHQTGGEILFFSPGGGGICFSPDRGRDLFPRIQEIFCSKAIKAEQ